MTKRTQRTATFTVAVTITLALTAACPPPFGGDRIPEVHRAFFKLPRDQRTDSITRYPIDQQIELYLIGMAAIHPPQMELAYEVASNGAPAIPAILSVLDTVKSDFVKSDLIMIFEDMVCFHNVDLRTKPSVMDPVRASIATIRHKVARARAQESLHIMADGCVARKAQARQRFSRLRADSND